MEDREQESLTAASAERRERMFKNILCPTDLKDRSDMAVKKAVQIAHQFGSKITVLNVHEEFMDKAEREMLRVSVNNRNQSYRLSGSIPEHYEIMTCGAHDYK